MAFAPIKPVDSKLDPANRTAADFEANDLGEPQKVRPVLDQTGRSAADFEANAVKNPGGSHPYLRLRGR